MIAAPPSLDALVAGTRLVAGVSYSTVLPDLDFETYSEAGYAWDTATSRWACLPRASQGKKGLSVVGAARYAEHPTTTVLSLSYDLKDGAGRRRWRPGQPPPADLFAHIVSGGLLEAWNVGFERHIWSNVCVPRMGWPPVARGQWRCAMAKSRAHGLPGALDNACKVLGTVAQKNPGGKRLLDRFSVPRNATQANPRLRILPDEDPEGPALYDYNEQDIIAEAEASSLTPDLPPDELEYWQADQDINSRGVQIDLPSVDSCAVIVEAALERYNAELQALTGGSVSAASEIQRLTGWLAGQGVYLESLDEEHVTDALKRTDLPPPTRRALEIRALVGSASVKKLFAMRNQVCADGRLKDLFSYHAARTGRCTGNGPQPTNLPNHGPPVWLCSACNRHYGVSKPCCPWCGSADAEGDPKEWGAAAVDDCLAVMAAGSLDLAEMFFDEALPAISGCLRGMFVAAPEHDLVCSDYSAIEAVVLAELAGEKWRQEVFRDHGKIYEMSASKAFGVPFEEMMAYRAATKQHHPLRKKGKVLELALGFGGWIGALIAFGADAFMTEAEMGDAAGAWRKASPSIIEYWGGQSRSAGYGVRRPEMFGIEGAAISAVSNPGADYECRGIVFRVTADVLYCRLLSGRYLSYHRPRLRPSERRSGELTLSFSGWNSNPKAGGFGWVSMDTYGPKLVENITQATARDIQRGAIVRQERAGYPVVLHVYDENVSEIPQGFGTIEGFEALMVPTEAWAAGWPIRAAGGWRGRRYRKD